MRTRIVPALVGLGLLAAHSAASAQPLGVFQWQIQPFCNVIRLDVTQEGGLFTLRGTDDQCGLPQQAGVVGLAFQNPDGTIGFGLTIVTAPGGVAVHLDAAISLSSLSGTWRDSAGNTGAFVFTPGAGQGGPPRPAPVTTIPPGSITAAHLAPGAVGPAQLAPGAIGPAQLAPDAVTGAAVLDGTLSGADLANGAIGTSKLANNAVTGAKVANGSLSAADLSDSPRAAFAGGADFVELTATPTVIRSVTLSIPAPGTVIANASGWFYLPNTTFPSAACVVTTGTSLDPQAFTVQSPGFLAAPFGATRGFAVTAGTFTVRLVCASDSSVEIYDTQLTATYTPGS
ncbi:MAG: hypothetical protein AB7Q16_21650 [Vicinamibacterales bacterium]